MYVVLLVGVGVVVGVNVVVVLLLDDDYPISCDPPSRRGAFASTASSTCTPVAGPHETFLCLTTDITAFGDCAAISKSIFKTPDS